MRDSNCGFRNSGLNFSSSREPPQLLHQISNPKFAKSNFSGCGVTLASEFWALEATVQFCPPRPSRYRTGSGSDRIIRAPSEYRVRSPTVREGNIRNRTSANAIVALAYARASDTCPRSLTEERFASNESGMGSNPIGGSIWRKVIDLCTLLNNSHPTTVRFSTNRT